MSKPRVAFQPGNSVLHQLHPLSKIGWLLFLTVFLFFAPSLWWVIVILVISLLAFGYLGVPIREIRGIRLFLLTALLLAFLQIVFNDDGYVIARIGPLAITDTGLTNGIYIGVRFLCVIFLSYLFVLTTSPNDLAYGLMQVGLPYRYGFALVTALRFVPIFEKEAQTIYQAQLMRGVRYDRGALRRLVTLARQFTLPILVSALRKVDALAVSMEGRSFGRYGKRNYYRPIRTTRLDWISLILLVMFVLAVIIG